MILGFHLIFTAYGFWLPNDPRGSWSDFVASWELVRAAGKATKVHHTRSVAHAPHDRAARLAAKRALKHPPVEWSGRQALAMTRGFQEVANEWGLAIHACSMLPRHVHLVIGRTDRDVTQVMNQLKGRASAPLSKQGIHPFQNTFERDGSRATCWTKRGWSVFLDAPADLRRAISYVEDNPVKDGHRRQHWSWLVPYDLR